MSNEVSLQNVPVSAPQAGDSLLGEQGGRFIRVPWTMLDPEGVRQETEALKQELDGRMERAEQAVAATEQAKGDMVALREATAQDREAVASDRLQTGQDRTATSEDRLATGQDRNQTGQDRVATGEDRVAVEQAAQAVAQQAGQVAEDRSATGQDRLQTGQDRAATSEDRTAVAQDRQAVEQVGVAVAQAAEQVAQHRAQTGEDRQATAADRLQTGEDRQATASDRQAVAGVVEQVSNQAAQVALDKQQTQQDVSATTEQRILAGKHAEAAEQSKIQAKNSQDAVAFDRQLVEQKAGEVEQARAEVASNRSIVASNTHESTTNRSATEQARDLAYQFLQLTEKAAQQGASYLNELFVAFSSAAAIVTALGTANSHAQAAQAQASLAATEAQRAASLSQQDLSGVNVAPLHRAPVPIVALPKPYRVAEDSNPNWSKQCAGTSWWNRPLNGAWLKPRGTVNGIEHELQARCQNATLGDELITLSAMSPTSGFTFTGGKWVATNTATNNECVQTPFNLVANTVYVVRLTVDALSGSGGISLRHPNVSTLTTPSAIVPAAAPGTYEFVFVATSNTPLWFRVTQTLTNCTISAISLKPVTAINTASGDYYPDATDGKFCRLFKNHFHYSEFPSGPTNLNTNTGGLISAASMSGCDGALAYGWNGADIQVGYKTVTPIVGATYLMTAEVEMDDGLAPAFGSSTPAGASNDFVLVVTGIAVNPTTYTVTHLGGARYRVAATINATGSNASHGIVKYATSSSRTFKTSKWQLQIVLPGGSFDSYEKKTVADTSKAETFDGNTRDFPAEVQPVVEAGRVILYDLTQPGCPMWMVLPSVAGSAIGSGSTAGAITSVACREGVLTVGTSNFGAVLFDFARDRYFPARSSGIGAVVVAGRISQRLSATYYSTVNLNPADYYQLPNNTVNAVSMTTMPDAPVDPVTGLQVPTIGLGTAGGMSVIKNDGTVVNSTASNYSHVQITPHAIFGWATGSTTAVQYALKPNSLSNNWSVTGFGGAAAPGLNGGVGTVTGIVYPRRDSLAIRYTGPRVGLCKFNESNPAASLGAQLMPDAATGWWAGDVRSCLGGFVTAGALSDTTKVVNGTFDTDISGWSSNVPGSGEWDPAGRLKVVTLSGGAWNYVTQAIPTEIGKAYRFTGDITNGTATSRRLCLGTSVQSTAYGLWTSGSADFTFVATTTTCYITCQNSDGVVGSTSFFDNITLTDAVADRSYKAKNARVYGTLPITPVAAGAQLCALSNFSAVNYVRAGYNPDFDFGTGQWMVTPGAVSIPAVLDPGIFPELTPDLITNGGFDTDTVWTKGANWTISGGKATHASGASSQLNQGTATVGKFYKGTFTVSGATNGIVNVVAGNGGSTGVQADGTYTQIVKAQSTTGLGVSCSTIFNGSVDDVIIKEVGPACLFERRGAAGAYWGLYLNPDGTLAGIAFDGLTTRTVTTTQSYAGAGLIEPYLAYTTDGTLAIWVSGKQVATATGTPLLSMDARWNLHLNTQDITVGRTRSGLLAGTATLMVPDTSTAQHFVQHMTSVGLPGTTLCTYSVTLKAAGYDWVIVSWLVNGTRFGRYINLITGAQGAHFSNAPASTVVEDAGGGAWRVSLSQTTVAANAQAITEIFAVAGGDGSSTSFAGDGVSGIEILNDQVVIGPARPYQRVGSVATDFDYQPVLTIGNSYALNAPFPGSIALLFKPTATVPSADAMAWMYEQHKQMLREGAQVTLPDSGSIVDMDYDPVHNRWVVESAANVSEFSGLVRVSSTPAPAGSYSKVAASNGIRLQARTGTNPGVDITLPPKNLREELAKQGAEQAALRAKPGERFNWTGGFQATVQAAGSNVLQSVNPVPVAGTHYPLGSTVIGAELVHAFLPAGTLLMGFPTATTIGMSAGSTNSGTGQNIAFKDFILPTGYEAEDVLVEGVAKQEGATKAWTRQFDGFRERVRFAVEPGYDKWVQIRARRMAA